MATAKINGITCRVIAVVVIVAAVVIVGANLFCFVWFG